MTDFAATSDPDDQGTDGPDGDAADGRLLRRIRNVEAVRDAILDLFADQQPVTLAAVAQQAGVAGRSIYRYFGDFDAAVAEAQQHRLDQIMARLDELEPIDTELDLEDRLDLLLDQRFELERLGRPLRFTRQQVNPDPRFDAFVVATFAPELDPLDDDRRRQIGNVVAWALRPRAIRSHLDSGEDAAWARDTIRFGVLSALAQRSLPSD